MSRRKQTKLALPYFNVNTQPFTFLFLWSRWLGCIYDTDTLCAVMMMLVSADMINLGGNSWQKYWNQTNDLYLLVDIL